MENINVIESVAVNPNAFTLTQYTNATAIHEGECGAVMKMGNVHMVCKSVFTDGGSTRFHHLTVLNTETGECICDVISSGNFPRLGAYTKGTVISQEIQNRMALVVKCHANSNHYLVNM